MAAEGGGSVTITRRLMKPGQFGVSLQPGTPKSVMSQIAPFDHVVVTRTRLNPIDAYSDANILTQSLYTGVIEDLSRTDNTLSGFGLEYWLGTPDGRGDLLDAAVARSAGALSAWIGDLRPSSLSAGTVNNTGTSTVTNTFQGTTRREAIDAVCRAAGAEWRVNPDFTLDAATAANLFVTSPALVITRRSGGNDGQYRGVEVDNLSTSESVSTYVTEAVVLGDNLVAATSAGSTSYKDGLNNNVVMQAFVSAPRDESATAAAAAVVAERNLLRRELTLTSRSYNVTRFVDPGDSVFVWDELAGLSNQSNQITYEGRLISPIALRVYSVSFPIEEGMGVYARRSGATPILHRSDRLGPVGDVAGSLGGWRCQPARFAGDRRPRLPGCQQGHRSALVDTCRQDRLPDGHCQPDRHLGVDGPDKFVGDVHGGGWSPVPLLGLGSARTKHCGWAAPGGVR
jgi:hypothetical protein